MLSYSVNFKSKEYRLSYSKLSESCTIAELTNNLEPIVYKYNKKDSFVPTPTTTVPPSMVSEDTSACETKVKLPK